MKKLKWRVKVKVRVLFRVKVLKKSFKEPKKNTMTFFQLPDCVPVILLSLLSFEARIRCWRLARRLSSSERSAIRELK